jgi:hypothetical protein
MQQQHQQQMQQQPAQQQPSMVSVQVPAGMGPGSTFQMQLASGQVLDLVVPAGASAGTVLQVPVPSVAILGGGGGVRGQSIGTMQAQPQPQLQTSGYKFGNFSKGLARQFSSEPKTEGVSAKQARN